jgi:fused signal recognition particle receptor
MAGGTTTPDLSSHVEVAALPPRQPDYADPGMVGLSLLLAVGFAGAVWVARNATLARVDVDAPSPVLVQAPMEPAPVDTAPSDELPAPTAAAGSPPQEEAAGILGRFRDALQKTRGALQGRLDVLFARDIDDSLFDDLEEALFTSDIGIETAGRIIEKIRQSTHGGDATPDGLRAAMKDEMRAILKDVNGSWSTPEEGPWVLLVVGVNGSGKTTTIGKLASRFKREGKSVLLAAGDTYRAAAAEQLTVWAERAGADIVTLPEGSDPGAVVYDAMSRSSQGDVDVVIIDTAGRLQTQKPLMEQLAKIRRVIQKRVPDGPHETLLVLDGTIGQNGLSQARKFNEATPLTGVVITKLDGTAKGGMVLTVAAEMGLPVKLVGIGEQIDDLRDFDAEAFVDALA